MTVVDRLHVRLADPSGIALPAAVIVLFIVTALGTAALAVSVSSSSSSRRDSYRKDALEAAEAGLRVARYRTTMLSPGSTYCVGTPNTPTGRPPHCRWEKNASAKKSVTAKRCPSAASRRPAQSPA